MPLKLMRSLYYVFLSVAGAFFIANLYSIAFGKITHDDNLVKSTALLVMFLILYISKVDKDYLIKSIPLRIVMFISSLSGLVLLSMILNLG